MSLPVRRANGTFVPGGAPGRPPGRKTRIQFQTAFISDLAAEWERSGKGVLKIVAMEEPGRFLQACVALMPRQLEADIGGPLADLSDDDLTLMLDHVRAQRAKMIKEMPAVIDGESQDN
jgi:hypothetical protein